MFKKRIQAIKEAMNTDKSNIKSLDFTTTAQMNNLEQLPLLEEWVWNMFGKEADLQIQPNIRPFNSTNDFRFLPKHIIEEAKDKCQEINKITKYDCEILHIALNDVVKNYDSEAMMYFKKEQSLKDMVSDIMNLDKLRNQNYKVSLGQKTIQWIDNLIEQGIYNV
tara:strand:- start:217 stop:711 length:495 start_codon:yes stop_codon:yes gene_type:complete